MAAARIKATYLATRSWRLAGRLGRKKAAMAVARSILVIAYQLMMSDDAVLKDLGADWSPAATTPVPSRPARP